MRRNILLGLVAASGLSVLGASAAEAPQNTSLKATLEKNVPGMKFKSVSKTPVAGLYEAVSEGGRVDYLTLDGRYMMDGDLIDRKKEVNITEEKRKGARLAVLNEVGEKQMIVFAPAKVKHTMTVFTDITCGYCRKLHEEMPELNQLGIKVRYMLFPRAGLGSPSAQALESVWCSADRNKALTLAKSGGDVPPKSCSNPIKKHMDVVSAFDLRGTPTIITETGALIPGYKPAAELYGMMEAERPAAK